MRLMVILALAAALSAGCGGSQPPEAPAAAPAVPAGSAAPPEPPRALAAPAAADLHGAPSPSAEDLRELYDIARDLQAVAASGSGAVADLAQDISRFAPAAATAPDVNALAGSLGRALQGRTLDDDAARRVAILLYVTMHAAEITPAQRTAAATALRQTLAATGAPAAAADATAALIK